jgi:hypothetical protein
MMDMWTKVNDWDRWDDGNNETIWTEENWEDISQNWEDIDDNWEGSS